MLKQMLKESNRLSHTVSSWLQTKRVNLLGGYCLITILLLLNFGSFHCIARDGNDKFMMLC